MTDKTDTTALVIAEELNEWARDYAPTELATALATCAAVLLKNQNARIAELEALQAAPPAPAAVAVLTTQQIINRFDFLEGAVTESTYRHIVETAQSIQLAAVPAQASFVPSFANGVLHSTALHKLWDEAGQGLELDRPGALAWQLGLFTGKVAQAAAAAAPAQEYATQLAGQGQTPEELMALSRECTKMPGGLGMHYQNYARAVLARWGAAPAQAREDARDAGRWRHFSARGVFPKNVWNNGSGHWQYGEIRALTAEGVADAAIAARAAQGGA